MRAAEIIRRLDVVEWLLALHPDTINAASHEGRTCLHLAAAKGSIEMVVLLCTKGCFIDPLMLHDVGRKTANNKI